jgi:hypothetical protein
MEHYKKKTNNKNNLNNMLMLEIDGEVTTHHQTIAERFNNYYVSVAKNITDNNPINKTNCDLSNINLLNHVYSMFKQSFTNIEIKNTTTNEIGKMIKELKSKKSCRYDEITTEILKVGSLFIVSPLTYLCNRMLSTGIFPDRIKFSEIKPVYKKCGKTLVTNYRSISLHPVFSNIFEKVIHKQYITI